MFKRFRFSLFERHGFFIKRNPFFIALISAIFLFSCSPEIEREADQFPPPPPPPPPLLDLADLTFVTQSDEIESVYGDQVNRSLVEIRNLAPGTDLSDVVDLKVVCTNSNHFQGIGPLIKVSEIDIEVDHRMEVGSSGSYQLEITGRDVYQGSSNIDFKVQVVPKQITTSSEIFYDGPIVTTQGVVTNRTLNLPDDFLVGNDTWADAVNFSIIQADGEPISENITVDRMGSVQISNAAVSNSGKYRVRIEGKSNYQGVIEVPITNIIYQHIDPNSPTKINFYGSSLGEFQLNDDQMGLGDLLWKENWITITPETLNLGSYQVVLRDKEGETVEISDLTISAGEIRVGAGDFDSDAAKKELISLNEGEITVDLLLGGVSVVPSGVFTKAFRKIRNWRDLQAIDFAPALTNDYTLMNDITLPAPGIDGGLVALGDHTMPATTGFDPIGDLSTPFTGTFDGNGYQISGLSINRPDQNYVGLFRRIVGSGKESHVGVRDLTLELSSYDDTTNIAIAGENNTGALAGYIQNTKVSGVKVLGRENQIVGRNRLGGMIGAANNSMIENTSFISGKIDGSGNKVGGLVGENFQSKISNSHATGSAEGSGDSVGGLVGYSYSGSKIVDSHATGSVNGSGVDSDKVGGLVGDNNKSEIKNSHATGSVNGSGDSVGGLVGHSHRGSKIIDSHATGSVGKSGVDSDNVGGLVGYNKQSGIKNSYATGLVKGSGNFVGGLVGYNEQSGIQNSYAKGEVTGGNSVGGLVGYNKQSKIQNSHATGSVNGSGNNVGGLVGYSYYQSKIKNSYATGLVKGSGNNVGGLVGYNKQSEIQNSYAMGLVEGSGNNVGGLVGYIESSGSASLEVRNSYWNKETTGQENSAGNKGLGMTRKEMRNENNFAGWDFNTIWAIDSNKNDGYPYLRNNPPSD